MFAADVWRSYSRPLPIRSAIPYEDGVIVATDGGIRFRSTVKDSIYTSKNGLETTAYYSLVSANNGIYAISEYGMVALLENGKSNWKVLNRSSVANGVRTLPDMAVSAGNIIVIGFENRIAFFDKTRKTFVLTVNRIDRLSLNDFSPQKIWIKDDSLYVALNGSQYVRKVDWFNLEKDMGLIDPDSWSRKGAYNDPTENSRVVLNGKVLNDKSLYRDGHSLVRWVFPTGNTTGYLVGENLISYYNGSSAEVLTFSIMNHIGEIYEMRPLSTGGILAASYHGLFARNDGHDWMGSYPVIWEDYNNSFDAESVNIKALAVTSDGFILYHLWGIGFFLYSDYGEKLKYKFLSTDKNLCMDQYIEDFPVSVAAIVAPDSLGFLTATASSSGYTLMYISLDGKMSCLKNVGSMHFAGPIFAKVSDDGLAWDVFVGTRKNAQVIAEGGFEKFRIVPPSRNSGSLSLKNKVSMEGLDHGAPVDMAYDKKRGVLWVATNSLFGYHEIDQDTIKQPSSVKGFSGAEITAIEIDVQGNIWLATSNQGVYRLSRVESSNDTLSVVHYSEKDGLLKDKVSDIAIDPVMGAAWFSHSNGLSVFYRNDLRNAENMMTESAMDVYAYPNPFRPKVHTHVSIDNIDEQSSVSIFNRGGALIRYFSGSDVLGGRADWDGNDKNGKLVTPGVYYYVVKGSSKVKKGKIIVIH